MSERRVGVVDVPITGVDDDDLGLGKYAEALGQFILRCDTPMTVGIQGDWGAGKTSLMNLIQGWLGSNAPDGPIPTFTLNTWQYAQLCDGDVLALMVLKALHSKIAGADEGLTKVWGQMASVFKRLKGVQALGMGIEMADPNELPDLGELKLAFARSVQARVASDEVGDRIVVFIDDLDRVLPERAVEILEAMKNFVDVPGCVFVLACDYAVVTKGLKKKFDVGVEDLGGRSFFDKIIQVPFRMPVYRYQVDRYVTAMLERIDWPFDEAEVGEYQALLQHSVGFNPRTLKRLCNTLLLLRMVAGEQADVDGYEEHRAMILFGLVCLESRYEEMYRELATAGTIQKLRAKLEPLRKRGADADSGSPPEHDRFMRTLVRILDENEDGTLDDEELHQLLAMLKLAAITSVAAEDDGWSLHPEPDELLAEAQERGLMDRFQPVLALVDPLLQTGLMRRDTTRSAVKYEVVDREWDYGRWVAVRVHPVHKKGARISFKVKDLVDNELPDSPWSQVQTGLIAMGAELSKKGNSLSLVIPDSETAEQVARLISRAWPFAPGCLEAGD